MGKYLREIKQLFKQEKRIVAIAIIVILGILLVYKICLRDHIPDYATYMGHADEEQFIYSLTNEDVIVQEFTSPHDFDFATLHFSDHDRTISGKAYIKAEDIETGETVSYQELENTFIHYGEPVKIHFADGGKEGVPYRITVSFEDMPELGLGIMGYKSGGSFLKPCNLKGDDGNDDYAVAVGTHSYTNKFHIFANIIVIYLCLMVCWALFVFTRDKWSIERRFFATAIPMGIFFLMFFNPNPVHDGETHLYKAYYYSDRLLGKDVGYINGHLSLRDDEYRMSRGYYYENYDLHIENNMLFVWEKYVNDFRILTENNNWQKDEQRGYTETSSLFEYFPAILAITIGRLFKLHVGIELLMAKIFTFIVYAGVCAYAIYIAPKKKSMIALVSLIPMNMYQATGISYDSIVTAICILLTALFIKSFSTSFSKADYFTIGICCFVLGRCKGGVYLLLPLIFMCIPKSVREREVKRIKIWLVGAAAGLLGVLPAIIKVYNKHLGMLRKKTNFDTASAYFNLNMTGIGRLMRPEEEYRYTIGYIMQNPIRTFKLIINSFFKDIEPMLGQAIGNRMAWTDEKTNWAIICGFIILIALSAIQASEEFEIPKRFRIIALVLILAEIMILYLVMLVAETGIYDFKVTGVQGRYLLPWAAVILLLLSSKRIKVDERGIRIEIFVYSALYAIYGMSFLMIFFNV